MKKLITILSTVAVAAFGVSSLFAADDDEFNWYDSSSAHKRETTELRIGSEVWHSSDKDKPLPYRFACGAVLSATEGGKRLDMDGVAVSKGGISSNGDIAIFLKGDNYVAGDIFAGWPTIYSSVIRIVGPGTLTISQNQMESSIHGSEVSIVAGASITINHGYSTYDAISATKLLIGASSVVVASNGNGICADTLNVIGSVVAVRSKYRGLSAYEGTCIIDGSVVTVVMDSTGGWSWMRMFSCKNSYCSLVCTDGYSINSESAYFDNSVVKLYSKVNAALSGDHLSFGEGAYYIASGSMYEAIAADNMSVNGGNIQVCTPGKDYEPGIYAGNFAIDAGRLEFVNKVDVRGFLRYDAAAAAAITGGIAIKGIDVAARMASFYSEVIVDAVSNGKLSDVSGVPYVGIECNTYTQQCGTVWCDVPKYGAYINNRSNRFVINGGSYKGTLHTTKKWEYGESFYAIDAPVDSKGNELACVPYAVSGAKKYDKITQLPTGVLPSGYGTGSLYADAAGKLYFWLPKAYQPGGGNSQGGGSGGNSGGSSGGNSQGGSGGGGSGGGVNPTPGNDVFHTVYFNANGGVSIPSARSVKEGSAVGTLPVPVRSGYTFAGWYSLDGGGTKVSSSTKVTADVTYYAQWVKNGETKNDENQLSGAYAADKARTFYGAVYSGTSPLGILALKIGKANKKGAFKTGGTLTAIGGRKYSLGSVSAIAGGGVVQINNISVKGVGTLSLKLYANGFTGTFSNGLTARTANIGNLRQGEVTFALNVYPASIGNVPVKTEYLPFSVKGTFDGKKIVFPKAGRVTYKSGTFATDKGGENNPSALKLTLSPKTGMVSGSFNIYLFNGRKFTKKTAKVSGCVIDGKAVMSITVPRVTFTPALRASM